MRISTLAQQLGTTPHAIRFYERRGLVPAPGRTRNRYREYSKADAVRIRLLIGLRQLDFPLEQAAELATMCAAGRFDQVSQELRMLVAGKRRQLERRVAEMQFLDQRLAHLSGQLEVGATPRTLINLEKEDKHAHAL